MNLKIQCPCGARYSFEVEPVNGRMPFAVKCPTCGVDGTEAANALIAEAMPAAPSVRIAVAAAPALTAAPAPDYRETQRAVQDLQRRKKAAEKKKYRAGVMILAVVIAAVVGYAGFWTWYYFFGSKPHVTYETNFGGQASPSVLFIAPDKLLMADSDHATLRDLKAEKDLWSTTFTITGAARKPQIFNGGASIWICLGGGVVQLDAGSGSLKKMIPIDGELISFSPSVVNILVVSAIDPTTRRAISISPSTGDSASQDIVIPVNEKHEMPNELPPNVQPTAGALEAQEEHKFSQPLDGMKSEVFAAGETPIELRVKLEEAKVSWVNSIKNNPTTINGETTASTTLFGVSDGVFNDLKRSQTGGAKRIDESKYEVKVRRFNGPKPSEWTGESIGPPTFFSLKTVDLVACGKTLIALDKQNQFLFQANLSYAVAERYLTNMGSVLAPPAAEGPGGLYFADQGVLTAFGLPGGDVRWRLTTVGVTKIQFDSAGALYVNSSTASPQDIQYSDQITFDKAKPVLIKLDPSNGKILWQQEGVGFDSFVAGKFLYATTENVGGMAMASALGEALGNVPDSDEPVRFHLYRINPATGQVMWDLPHQGAPSDFSFQDNRFVLCYDHDVQAWRFLSF